MTYTDTAAVQAVSDYMMGSIGTVSWPGAGRPVDWYDPAREQWFAVGNAAVLEQRASIEAGNTTAGAVWCAAARATGAFDYTGNTEVFLHEWFVQHRDRIVTIVENAGQGTEQANAVFVHDGVEYVRKDVIDSDMRVLKEKFSEAAQRENLCGVYDRVQGEVDSVTSYVKVGTRPRRWHVTVQETYTVNRVRNVTASGREDAERQVLEALGSVPLLDRDVSGTGDYSTGHVSSERVVTEAIS